MPRVSFTQNLQRHVPCPDISVEGDTVRSALDEAFHAYPKLRGYILTEQGSLHRHMAVIVNGESTLDRESLSQAVGPGDEIYIMQALSGG